MIEKLYPCKYCNAKFAKEKTLSVHMCEQKRRYLQKDERRVQLGFQTFVRFYELCQKVTTPKTYEEFCKSPYYTAFVKFGIFLGVMFSFYIENIREFLSSAFNISLFPEEIYFLSKMPTEINPTSILIISAQDA